MPDLISKHRLAAIGTPLDEDHLLLRRMHGRERISEPFSYLVEMVSEDPDIPFDKLIGENATIRLSHHSQEETRFFNGIVADFRQLEPDHGLNRYEATLVPWLWFLTKASDCRIFQKLKVPDILTEVFKAHGFEDFEQRLSATYPVLDYCVQYRETDFAFVSRLMEEVGIYYFFVHEDGKHTLVLADSRSAHDPCPDFPELVYVGPEARFNAAHEVQRWEPFKQVTSGAFTLTDYNFAEPKKHHGPTAANALSHNLSSFAQYDYEGEFTEDGGSAPAGKIQLEDLAKIRLQALQAEHLMARGHSDCRGLFLGHTFELKLCYRKDQNGKHLITEIHHSINLDDYFSAAGGGGGDKLYSCTFLAIPDEVEFRPARRTPKPRVAGPQTAFVVGRKGEEIDTDQFGRVRLQFHWDRNASGDEKSSCWVRVSQNWAGKKWGAFFLPRVGQEVIVDFIEGDPDRPIVTGRVYNDENKPPYDLPAEKTKSTIKSNSSKEGGGFNEFRFEDKKGDEEIFLHAEKDLEIRVKATRKESVLGNRHLVVGGERREHVKGDRHGIVEGNYLDKVEGDRGFTVEGNRHGSVEGDDHLDVTGDRLVNVSGGVGLEVGTGMMRKVGGDVDMDGAMNINTKAGMNYAVDAGMGVHIKAGMTCVIEAGVQLSLKVGGSFVDIGPAGVSISGPTVLINSGGAAGSGGGCSPASPASPEPPDPPEKALAAVNAQAGQVDDPPPARNHVIPSVMSSAALVLLKAAEDGTPLCEECNRTDPDDKEEELEAISSIAWLDGDEETEVASATQWVNLPREAKWVDADKGLGNQDRFGRKPRFKVKFSIEGAHKFKVRAEPGADNVAYTDTEKGRNENFKYMEEEKEYTTDADGTKIIEDDFFFPCAGGDKFKLVAEDENNNPPVETGELTTRRIMYGVIIKMRGMADPSLGATSAEFAKHGIEMPLLPTVEIEPMENIGVDDSETYINRCKTAFNGSEGKAKSPYSVAIGFTDHLAVKNPNVDLEQTDVTVGPGESAVVIPVMARGLRSGDGLAQRALWRELVTDEGWFVSASYTPAGGSPVAIPEEKVTEVLRFGGYYNRVSVDVTDLPAGNGTLRVRVNVVDRMRAGLSFRGGNLVCICQRAWWQNIPADEQSSTAIHELGHKVGMVSDGAGKKPDKVITHYLDKGHVGDHCFFDLGELDTYSGVSGNKCVMFGAVSRNPPSDFCENCAPAVKKMDLSAGWPTS